MVGWSSPTAISVCCTNSVADVLKLSVDTGVVEICATPVHSMSLGLSEMETSGTLAARKRQTCRNVMITLRMAEEFLHPHPYCCDTIRIISPSHAITGQAVTLCV